MRFPVILCDPAWRFKSWSEKQGANSRRADKHYAVELAEDMSTIPVRKLAAKDCVLLMWTTGPFLKHSIELMGAWGFEYKACAFTWVKHGANKEPVFGLGKYTRSSTEFCLLGTIGAPRRSVANIRQVIECRRGRHSAKPHEVYDRIEKLFKGPYVEVFARNRRNGWSSLGLELDGLDLRESIPMLANGADVPAHHGAQPCMDSAAFLYGQISVDDL